MIRYPVCNTPVGTPEWTRHLDELARLEDQAERLKLYPLPLELACLFLEHKSFEWTQKEK